VNFVIIKGRIGGAGGGRRGGGGGALKVGRQKAWGKKKGSAAMSRRALRHKYKCRTVRLFAAGGTSSSGRGRTAEKRMGDPNSHFKKYEALVAGNKYGILKTKKKARGEAMQVTKNSERDRGGKSNGGVA